MDKKILLLSLGAALLLTLLIVAAITVSALSYLNGRPSQQVGEPAELTLCDVNASGLCVVSFAVDQLDQMLINLHLPHEDYPSFYARISRGSQNANYSCKAVEDNLVSIFCTGPRMPLGETVEVTIIGIENQELIAQGLLVISSIALPSPVNFTLAPEDLTNQPFITGTPFRPPLPGLTPGATEVTPSPGVPFGTQRPPIIPGTLPATPRTLPPTVTGTIFSPLRTTTPQPTGTYFPPQ